MTTPLHKNPCPEGHEIYNFGRHFFGHHNYTLCLFTVNFTECDLMLRITTLLVFFKSISRLSETDDVVYTMLIINTPCMRYYDVSHIAPYTLYLFQNETYKYYSQTLSHLSDALRMIFNSRQRSGFIVRIEKITIDLSKIWGFFLK